MQPASAHTMPMILNYVVALLYLAFMVSTISWCLFVALRLRDIAERVETMNIHQETQARNLASIASSLETLVSKAATGAGPGSAV